MKSLVRWSVTLGLVGSTLLGTLLAGTVPVLALPDKQIKDTLDSVPVFLITNPQGIPLTRTIPQGQNGQKPSSVTQVFMNGEEAEAVMKELRNQKDKDPKIAELVKSLQVTPVPMGVIYQTFRDSANKPDPLLFVFQPGKQEIGEAITLLRASGQQVQQFPGVPIFIVRSPDKGYISIKRPSDNKEIIPLFLSKKDAQGLLTQVKAKVPKADIQVVDIDGIIKTLQDKNDAWLSQIALVPSSESVDYINKLLANNAPKTPAAPNQQNSSPATPKKPNQR